MLDDLPAAGITLVSRRCPVCGATGGRVLPANVDPERLDGFAFASRKVPEYMHWRLVSCPSCDTQYADPAPPQDVLQAAYVGAEFDSAEAARSAARTYAGLLPGLLATTPSGLGALDVGTGEGAFLRELQRAGVDDVLGIEPSPAAAAAALPDVRPLIRAGTFPGVEVEDGRFRIVTAFQMLEHVADPLGLCRAARNVLHDGGALAVVCHDRRAPLNRLLGRRSPIFDVQHLQLFSRRSVRELLGRAGFSRVEVRPLVNRYPLRVWARYLPLPDRVKERVLDRLQQRAGALTVPLPVGNLVAIGYRDAESRTAVKT